MVSEKKNKAGRIILLTFKIYKVSIIHIRWTGETAQLVTCELGKHYESAVFRQPSLNSELRAQ